MMVEMIREIFSGNEVTLDSNEKFATLNKWSYKKKSIEIPDFGRQIDER